MAEQEEKEFHLLAILSVTTGFLIAPNGIDDVYELIDYLSGHSNYTHELPEQSRRLTPKIFEQLPQLVDVCPPLIGPLDEQRVDPDVYRLWYKDAIKLHGKKLKLHPVES